jgi:hypothetical protein
MAYVVEGKIEVSIYINNQEFPLESVNTLNFLKIAWTTRGLLPLCHFSIFDGLHTLDQVELQDGIPLRITLKPLQSPTVTYNFRKFHHKKDFNGNGFTYEVDGYLDFPLYWAGTSIAGIQGTSSDALQQIASKCGMTFQGSSTTDPQLWMPRNKTFGEFANSIKKRGFASANSYMELGVNPSGLMVYKDVTQLPAPTQTVILGEYQSGSYTAADYNPMAKSGLTNKMTGYQNTRYAQSMVGQNLSQANSQITFSPDVTAPLFNTTMQQQVSRGYQTFGGIDVGNTHPNYETAIYQNMRIANLYSLDVEFLIQTPTTFNLLDTFTFAVDSDINKQDAAYAGTYIIGGRGLLVTGAQYAEKILGVRQGLNAKYTSG